MISPLLKSAIEMFEHAVEHYMAGSDRDRKLMVLHCDQAVELILKDKVRDSGESVFLKNGQTVTYYDAIKLLEKKGIKIPEKPDLELLHDQRNVIQHKGAQVSQSDAEFYIRKSFEFVKRFLRDELDKIIGDMIDKRYLEVFGIKAVEIPYIAESERETEDISEMLRHAREFEILSHKYLESLGLVNTHRYTASKLIQKLRTSGIRIKVEDKNNLKQFFAIRNQIAHTDYVPSKVEIKLLIDSIRKINCKLRQKLEIKIDNSHPT